MRIAAVIAAAACIAVALGTNAFATLTLETIWGSSGSGDGQFQFPQGVAVDGAGNVYVADQNNGRIEKFDANGAFILKWGSFGSNNGQFSSPVGVAVDGAGNVYVTDAGNYRVGKFDSNGNFIQQIGVGYLQSNPRMLTVAPNGDLYVTESTRVTEFTPTGTVVRSWGTQGTGPGQFTDARGIVADAAGNIYVADLSDYRVEKFTSDGTYLSSFGTRAAGPGQLQAPYSLAIAPNGHIFVGDNYQYAIVEFAADGTPIAADTTASGTSFRPQGIAVNGAGDLYIADNQANTGNRVLKVRPTAAPPPPPPAVVPPPVVGKSVDVQVEAGTVLVKPPPGVTLKVGVRPAQNGFVKLTNATNIPVGSLVDTTHGQVGLTSAVGTAAGLQKGSFYSGQFKIIQKKATKATTELQLSQPLSCGKKGKAQAAAARSRRLWGNAKGRFRTRGRYSSATVRGTKWLTKDTCTSTLTEAKSGTVTVRDFVLNKTVTVKKGHKYLARKR